MSSISAPPLEATLQVVPQGRVDATDVRAQAAETFDHAFDKYARCLYCSLHTTAGYLPQSLASRLQAGSRGVGSYIDLFRAVFPEGAGYHHDDLGRRDELTADEKAIEPLNADSHLAFIGGGLHACVSYRTARPGPVYFIDLDGSNAGTPRRRITTLVGYNDEIDVAHITLRVPVSAHPIDAVNLKQPGLGLYDEVAELVARHDVTKGRVRMSLASGEQSASLTVNEYETLLLRHDLAEVLKNPIRFAVQKARHMWDDPGAVPFKALEYAKYDLVRAVNRFVDALGLGESRIEQILAIALAVPAARFLRARRAVDLLVSDSQTPGRGHIVEGKYQAPLMIQWRHANQGTRLVDVKLTRFV